ncbi:MAG: HupE/UreJ family protein [Bacteroidota bacterium]
MKPSSFPKFIILLCLFLPLWALAHGVSPADQAILTNGGLLSYIWVGAKHMLTGYDHLLFLVGVIFYLDNFRDIVRFITVFTIGHSITLISATYLGIQANEHLIDAVIALSVLYKGFENLGGFQTWFGTKSPNLLMMVFLFGLIHGFGLSTRLQSFDLGEGQFLAKIVSFNIGVELGQVLALIPIVFVLSRWKGRDSYRSFYQVANWFLVVAGIGLFGYQMYGYFYGAEHAHEHVHDHSHDGHSHGDGHQHSHDGHSHGSDTHHSHGDDGHSHGDGHQHSHDDHSHGSDTHHSHGDDGHSHGDGHQHSKDGDDHHHDH